MTAAFLTLWYIGVKEMNLQCGEIIADVISAQNKFGSDIWWTNTRLLLTDTPFHYQTVKNSRHFNTQKLIYRWGLNLTLSEDNENNKNSITRSLMSVSASNNTDKPMWWPTACTLRYSPLNEVALRTTLTGTSPVATEAGIWNYTAVSNRWNSV